MLRKMETMFGTFLAPEAWREDDIVKDISSNSIHGWRVAEAMVRYWEPETAIIDVGCNLGQMSVCVARATQAIQGGGDTQVIAVEARPSLADLADRNLSINRIQGEVIRGAAWSISDVSLPLSDVNFEIYGSVGSLGIADTTTKTSEYVRSIRLDDVVVDRRVSVLKLDIQGSEFEAIQGSVELINRDAPVIIFEFEEMFAPQFGVTFASYVDLLSSLGYKIREVVGSNNYLAIQEDRFGRELLTEFDRKRRRMPKTEFYTLAMKK